MIPLSLIIVDSLAALHWFSQGDLLLGAAYSLLASTIFILWRKS
jgi:hypothetical protein